MLSMILKAQQNKVRLNRTVEEKKDHPPWRKALETILHQNSDLRIIEDRRSLSITVRISMWISPP
jgi:hypothetical protein